MHNSSNGKYSFLLSFMEKDKYESDINKMYYDGPVGIIPYAIKTVEIVPAIVISLQTKNIYQKYKRSLITSSLKKLPCLS